MLPMPAGKAKAPSRLHIYLYHYLLCKYFSMKMKTEILDWMLKIIHCLLFRLFHQCLDGTTFTEEGTLTITILNFIWKELLAVVHHLFSILRVLTGMNSTSIVFGFVYPSIYPTQTPGKTRISIQIAFDS